MRFSFLKVLICQVVYVAVVVSLLGFTVGPTLTAYAQSATATLSGAVVDPQDAIIAGALITVVDADRSIERQATTNSDGYFTFAQLPPSTYTVTVQRDGFATAQLSNVVLNVGNQSGLRIQLRVAAVGETVTVNAADAPLIGESPAVATVVDRQFIENQPLNGRSFQTLVELAPGVVITPSNLPSPGQFSVNGQRTSSNYFTVDGVSANFGSTASVTLYETAGGAVPSYSALGSTASLASVDAVQEFSVQTSTYAPEFGRQPGAQISLVTRSGTNDFHGNAFDYVRNDVFDANNFFANAAGLPRPAIRQHDFGGTLSGPVMLPRFGERGAGGEGTPAFYSGRNRTFFFLSYEGVRLRQPFVTQPLQVPSLAARSTATGVTRDLLNAFPLPTGPALASDPNVAPYIGSFSNPSTLDATSLRVDHSINSRVSIFGRYNRAPSQDLQRARFCAASCVADLTYNTETFTTGATALVSARVTNDFRFNYSKSRVNQTYFIDTFGGAVVPPASSLYPSFTSDRNGYIYIAVSPGEENTLSDGLFSDNRNRQINVVNTLSATLGAHTLKFGADYRRIAPVSDSGSYKRQFLPGTVSALVSGVPSPGVIVAPDVVLRPTYTNFSTFAQDTWRTTDRLTLTYGLRYEVVPAPSEENGNLPPTITSDPGNTAAPLALASSGTRLYETTYTNVAPRGGFAYQLFSNRSTVLRGGFGVFHDLGYNFTGSAFSTGIYPYARTLRLSNVAYTSPDFAQQPPANNPNPPYPRIFAYRQGYQLPYTLQYNIAVEQAFGANDTITVTYTGASGRRLPRIESLRNLTPAFTRIDFGTNGGTSNYNALQAQYQRRLARGLQALASYTFAKSLDTVSDESQSNLQASSARFNPALDRGHSGFDVRHAFNLAISYTLPSPFREGVGRAVFGGFGLDTIVRARTATPVNVLTGRDPFGLGFTTVARPDLIPGQPLYIEDPALPGGRRFNPAAFDAATPLAQQRQGSLGRNVLRGFPASQMDLSLRRGFDLTERIKLQFRVDAFNVFNNPNFANPSGIVSAPNFGRATQMLSTGLGGLSSLYQIGGPRSFQLALKVGF